MRRVASAERKGVVTVDEVSTLFAVLTVGVQIAVVILLAALIIGERGRPVIEAIRPSAIALAWVVALGALAGSLYYSEAAGFVPCDLCWYQRIAMYPLAVILGIAAVRRDAGVWRYAVPLAAIGAGFAAYHYTIQRLPGLGACDPSSPCTLTWVWRLHYVSIPMMALSAFALIVVLLAIGARREGATGGDQG